jgi:glycosyltransferase involved in cell wall biosynthesis
MPDSEENRKIKVAYIERKYWRENFLAFSLEKIFEQVARLLQEKVFSTEFTKLPFGNSILDILKNLLLFRPPNADIFHITGQVHYIALTLPPKATVLTIHDLAFLQNGGSGIKKYVAKKLFLDLPVRRLNFITTVSKATRQAILDNTNCHPEKIRVIENPVQEHYINSEPKEFNKECPTILQVGITENKNIFRLIGALKNIDCRLKIVGNKTNELVSALNESKIDYEFVLGLTDLEMREAYRTADIVTFCSTYEGFGLPIIESQAMMTPVLTSNISPMKEVAGGGAVLVDPFDVESIRTGILKIINDKGLRIQLIDVGSQNVKKYQPAAITRKYEELYLEIAAQLSSRQ